MIDVHCACGRTYRVPSDKRGRKLQCRSCGGVLRVPDPGASDPVFVPFQMPGDSSALDERGDPAGSGPPLDFKSPLRRCPSCGFQDEPTVVLCVRCGYDWRSGRRLDGAYDAAAKSERRRRVPSGPDELATLGRLGWIALSPLGLLVGPYVFVQTLAAERRARVTGRAAGVVSALQQVRVMAGAGTFLWAAVALFAGVVASRGPSASGDQLAGVCEQRLERVGKVLRSRIGSAPFPTRGELEVALDQLAQGGSSLAPSDLRCPLGGELYGYRIRRGVRLEAGTAPEFLVAWDQEPHDGLVGAPSGFRALRRDGRIEVFGDRAALEEALSRAPRAAAQGPGEQGGGGEGAQGPETVRTGAFLTLARDAEAADPSPLRPLPMTARYFAERVGQEPGRALPTLLADPNLEIRRAAARMVARVEMPAGERVELGRALTRADDPAVRLGGVLALRQGGAAEWLALAADLAEAGTPEADTARALLGVEAAGGVEAARAVLAEAARLRRRAGAEGDDAMFRLAPGALPHVARLLGDPSVGREAVAALYSAGPEGALAAREVLEAGDASVGQRRGAFVALDQLREKGVFPLADYLGLLSREGVDEVRAAAFATLGESGSAPDALAVGWALQVLRAGTPGERLAVACRKLLARIGRGQAGTPEHEGALALLVDDLARAGDHGPVLAELGAPYRLLDERLDQLLVDRWKTFEEVAVRRALVAAARVRPLPGALAPIARALEDPVEDVRLAALEALAGAQAPIEEPTREELGKLLARRLTQDEDLQARRVIYDLLQGSRFCGGMDAPGAAREHRCTPEVWRALRRRALSGDPSAVRALGTHPSRATIELMLELLERFERDQRSVVAQALRNLTGRRILNDHPRVWKEEAAKPDVADHLRAESEKRQQEVRRARERAHARLERLRESS